MGGKLGSSVLGKMGTPLTRNLIADGHKVSGFRHRHGPVWIS